jgi:ribonuclease D
MKAILHLNDLSDDVILSGDIAIDTETMGLNLNRDRLCVVQLCDAKGNVHIIKYDGNQYSSPNLTKFLENEKVTKIFHFGRFDIAVLKKYLDIDMTNIYCTKIASRIARTYTDSHGLKELCRELLGVQISKAQQSSDWGNNSLSKDQIEYAKGDVIYLHRIREILNNMLIREDRDSLAEQCFEFLPSRVLLDLSGWETLDIFAH